MGAAQRIRQDIFDQGQKKVIPPSLGRIPPVWVDGYMRDTCERHLEHSEQAAENGLVTVEHTRSSVPHYRIYTAVSTSLVATARFSAAC